MSKVLTKNGGIRPAWVYPEKAGHVDVQQLEMSESIRNAIEAQNEILCQINSMLLDVRFEVRAMNRRMRDSGMKIRR